MHIGKVGNSKLIFNITCIDKAVIDVIIYNNRCYIEIAI